MTFTIYDADMAPGGWDAGAGTTMVTSPSSAIPVAKVALAFVAFLPTAGLGADTEGTTNGSIDDTKGNTWLRMAEGHRNSQKVSGGIYYSIITTQIETTDTVTFTSSVSFTLAAGTLAAFSMSVGTDVQIMATDYEITLGTAYSTSLSGLTSEEHLWIGHDVGGHAVPGIADASYTAFTQGGATAWDAAGAACGGSGGYLISTGTSETYDRTGLNSCGRVTMLVALKEVTAGAGTTVVDPFGMSGFFGA